MLESSTFALTLWGRPWQGESVALFQYWQEPPMCTSLTGAPPWPTPFAFWLRVSPPFTTSGPFEIDAVFCRQRLPSTNSGVATLTLWPIVMSHVDPVALAQM